LSQLISLGTLRPILDEYCTEEDRLKFMERHGETLLEGMEIEHLVTDPQGTITVDDINHTRSNSYVVPVGTYQAKQQSQQ
jgi:hypothetical protein